MLQLGFLSTASISSTLPASSIGIALDVRKATFWPTHHSRPPSLASPPLLTRSGCIHYIGYVRYVAVPRMHTDLRLRFRA